MSVRPLRRGLKGDGTYVSADGEWLFSRDDNRFTPTPDDRDAGVRSIQPGRRWDIGRKDSTYGFVIVDTAKTLAEAVAMCERKARP